MNTPAHAGGAAADSRSTAARKAIRYGERIMTSHILFLRPLQCSVLSWVYALQRVRVYPWLMRRSLCVLVVPGVAGGGVLDRHLDSDVGQAAQEDPEPVVEAAAVQHLDRQLDVGRIEEPEGAGILGEGQGLALTRVPS